MTVKQKAAAILRAARALLAKPDGWTKGAEARTKEGFPVRYDSKRSTCFCTVGAIMRITGGNTTYASYLALDALRYVKHSVASLDIWNDAAKSVKPILAGFDKAIAALEE
jgi:hypothetical protein